MKTIKLKVECPSCEGTGIYVGIGERGGAGVVCNKCKGTGCFNYTYSYKEFVERIKTKDIKRVYLSGLGYCITANKAITMDNGVYVDFPNEGVSYEEFCKGKMPKHIKSLGCPMRADQGACHNIKGFTEECDKINGGYLSVISACKCKNKLECWNRFEKGEQK